MMTREESKALVDRVLSNEPYAFDEFYEQFEKSIANISRKWVFAINRISSNLYDIDDICNELWLKVLEELPKYDSERSSLVTWLYLMCKGKAGKIYRYFNNTLRSPNENNMSIFNNVSSSDDNNTELIDMIIDPKEAFDIVSINESLLSDYIYVLKDLILKLGTTQRIVYLQIIRKELVEAKIGALIGISQVTVNRIKHMIIDEAIKLWNNIDSFNIDHRKADEFAMSLLSKETDDELSDRLNYDLAVIKICREVLYIADFYGKE